MSVYRAKFSAMEIDAIGHIETGYAEKFGVPRQPGLVSSAKGKIIFETEYRGENFLRGIEGFSHLWVLFHFHQAKSFSGKSTVRPPRLGGNERVGVFATRASHRPNGIGMSVVELVRVDYDHPDGPLLEVSGVDMVSGTPVIDVKPYIAFSDSHAEARGGFVTGEPDRLIVEWECETELSDQTRLFIEETLSLDPRPAYQVDADREYGCVLDGYEIKWTVSEGIVLIKSCR